MSWIYPRIDLVALRLRRGLAPSAYACPPSPSDSNSATCRPPRRLMSRIMTWSRDPLVGLRLRGAIRGLRQSPHDAAAGELDLESVVGVALGVAQEQIGGARERRRPGRLPAQRRLGRRIAPGLVGDAAERQTGLLDGVAIELERSRNRDQRERIGQAIADLQVAVVAREALGWNLDRDDDLVVR